MRLWSSTSFEIMDSSQQIDYTKYENRLESFSRWPNESPDLIKELAEAGFYFSSEPDVVKCFACGVKIGEWHDGDSPLERHEEKNEECRHLADRALQKVQLQNSLNNSDDPIDFDEFGFDHFEKRVHSAKKYYSNLSSERLNSIASAGLFYNDSGNLFECYCCHTQFDAPEVVDSDDVIKLHSETNSSCKHICLVTGDEKQPDSKPLVKPRKPSSPPSTPQQQSNVSGLSRNRDTKPRTIPTANGLKLKIPEKINKVPSSEKQIINPRLSESHACAMPSQPGYHKHFNPQPGSASPDFSGSSSPVVVLSPLIQKFPEAGSFFPSPFSRQSSNRSIPSDDEIMSIEGNSPIQFPSRKSTLKTKYGRLQTFLTWPQEALIQPNELCEAGFYYMGEDDGVKCYVCGILLRNWEMGDTAWGEHKKWSRNCPLVIEHDTNPTKNNSQYAISGNVQHRSRQHGRVQQNFYDISIQNTPHVPCPPIFPSAPIPPYDYRYQDHSTAFTNMPTARFQNIFQPLLNYGSQHLTEQQEFVRSQPLPNYDDESCKESTEVEQIGELSKESLDLLLEAGFPIEIINNVQKMGLEKYGEYFDSVEATADAIVHFIDKGNLDEHSRPDKKNAKSDEEPPADQQTKSMNGKQSDLKRELDKVREMQLCKICMDEQIGAAFHPCGHLFTCPKCAEGLQQCPVCRANIDSISRVYLS